MHELLRSTTQAGEYLGAVALIARNGTIVDERVFGHLDLERTVAMPPDAIFRIYSMTKTVATVAALMLMEEGKLALDDRVGKHLAEFSARSVTIRQLLTHTSGFATPTEAMEKSANLDAYSKAAAAVPQAVEPGTRFQYNSVNTEVAARVIEVTSGKPLDVFLRERLFGPLSMPDTGFSVPADQRSRLAAMTSTDGEGRLIAWPAGDAQWPGDRMRPYFSAAGGLYSTARDFARFCQMLLDGGRFQGTAILRPETIAMMMTNQLTGLDPPVTPFNDGFGLGGFVNLDSPGRTRPGSVGAFGWSGAAATYYMVDPRQRMFAILLLQHIPQSLGRDPQKLSFTFYNLVYQSLTQ